MKLPRRPDTAEGELQILQQNRQVLTPPELLLAALDLDDVLGFNTAHTVSTVSSDDQAHGSTITVRHCDEASA